MASFSNLVGVGYAVVLGMAPAASVRVRPGPLIVVMSRGVPFSLVLLCVVIFSIFSETS